jgi:poly(hydroxyalkanoate) granule-associated protein
MPTRKTDTTIDDLASRIRESSHDVVLAGLASLARAYGSDANRTHADFGTLVEEGRKLGPELQAVARKAWSEWTGKTGSALPLRFEGRLHGVFDERVMSVLVRMGVPTRAEIEELRAKVDDLLALQADRKRPAARAKKTTSGRARKRRSRDE